MREDQIRQAVGFLKGSKMQNISQEEKKKFLESKLTEEEIAEVFKRVNEQQSASSSNSDPLFNNIQGGKQIIQPFQQENVGIRRIEQTNSQFMQSVNVASIAVLSALGVTYVIDRMRDKKDKHIREEIKERVFDSLKENGDRLREMQQEQERQKVAYISKENVEKMIQEKIEQYDNGKFVGDSKNRAMTLKLRQNPSQLSQSKRGGGLLSQQTNENEFSSEYNRGMEDQDWKGGNSNDATVVQLLKEMSAAIKEQKSLNIELVKEIKDLKNSLIQISNGGSAINNVNVKQIEEEVKKEQIEKNQKEGSQTDYFQKKLIEEKQQQQQLAEQQQQVTTNFKDLSEEQLDDLKQKVDQLLGGVKDVLEKQQICIVLSNPLQRIIKNPNEENIRTISINSGMFKKIPQNNNEFTNFLLGIGFTKKSEVQYKFEKYLDKQQEAVQVQEIQNIEGENQAEGNDNNLKQLDNLGGENIADKYAQEYQGNMKVLVALLTIFEEKKISLKN